MNIPAPEPSIVIIVAKNLEDQSVHTIVAEPYTVQNEFTRKDKEGKETKEVVSQFVVPISKWKHVRTNNSSYATLYESFSGKFEGKKIIVVHVTRADGKLNVYLKPFKEQKDK